MVILPGLIPYSLIKCDAVVRVVSYAHLTQRLANILDGYILDVKYFHVKFHFTLRLRRTYVFH